MSSASARQRSQSTKHVVFDHSGILSKVGSRFHTWRQRVIAVSVQLNMLAYFENQKKYAACLQAWEGSKSPLVRLRDLREREKTEGGGRRKSPLALLGSSFSVPHAKGFLDIHNAYAYPVDYLKDRPWAVEIDTPNRVFHVCMVNSKERDEWLIAFVQAGCVLKTPSPALYAQLLRDEFKDLDWSVYLPSVQQEGGDSKEGARAKTDGKKTAKERRRAEQALSQLLVWGKHGFLKKRGQLNKNFKTRFFRTVRVPNSTTQYQIDYFQDMYTTTFRNGIPVTLPLPMHDPGKSDSEYSSVLGSLAGNEFYILSGGRYYVMQAHSQLAKDRWMRFLTGDKLAAPGEYRDVSPYVPKRLRVPGIQNASGSSTDSLPQEKVVRTLTFTIHCGLDLPAPDKWVLPAEEGSPDGAEAVGMVAPEFVRYAVEMEMETKLPGEDGATVTHRFCTTPTTGGEWEEPFDLKAILNPGFFTSDLLVRLYGEDADCDLDERRGRVQIGQTKVRCSAIVRYPSEPLELFMGTRGTVTSSTTEEKSKPTVARVIMSWKWGPPEGAQLSSSTESKSVESKSVSAKPASDEKQEEVAGVLVGASTPEHDTSVPAPASQSEEAKTTNDGTSGLQTGTVKSVDAKDASGSEQVGATPSAQQAQSDAGAASDNDADASSSDAASQVSAGTVQGTDGSSKPPQQQEQAVSEPERPQSESSVSDPKDSSSDAGTSLEVGGGSEEPGEKKDGRQFTIALTVGTFMGTYPKDHYLYATFSSRGLDAADKEVAMNGRTSAVPVGHPVEWSDGFENAMRFHVQELAGPLQIAVHLTDSETGAGRAIGTCLIDQRMCNRETAEAAFLLNRDRTTPLRPNGSDQAQVFATWSWTQVTSPEQKGAQDSGVQAAEESVVSSGGDVSASDDDGEPASDSEDENPQTGGEPSQPGVSEGQPGVSEGQPGVSEGQPGVSEGQQTSGGDDQPGGDGALSSGVGSTDEGDTQGGDPDRSSLEANVGVEHTDGEDVKQPGGQDEKSGGEDSGGEDDKQKESDGQDSPTGEADNAPGDVKEQKSGGEIGVLAGVSEDDRKRLQDGVELVKLGKWGGPKKKQFHLGTDSSGAPTLQWYSKKNAEGISLANLTFVPGYGAGLWAKKKKKYSKVYPEGLCFSLVVDGKAVSVAAEDKSTYDLFERFCKAIAPPSQE